MFAALERIVVFSCLTIFVTTHQLQIAPFFLHYLLSSLYIISAERRSCMGQMKANYNLTKAAAILLTSHITQLISHTFAILAILLIGAWVTVDPAHVNIEKKQIKPWKDKDIFFCVCALWLPPPRWLELKVNDFLKRASINNAGDDDDKKDWLLCRKCWVLFLF